MQFESEFIVVPDKFMDHTIILGNNFFGENRVELDMARRRMSGSSRNGCWDLYMDVLNKGFIHRNIPVVLSEDVSVRPGETILVPVQIDAAGLNEASFSDMFFESSDNRSASCPLFCQMKPDECGLTP